MHTLSSGTSPHRSYNPYPPTLPPPPRGVLAVLLCVAVCLSITFANCFGLFWGWIKRFVAFISGESFCSLAL